MIYVRFGKGERVKYLNPTRIETVYVANSLRGSANVVARCVSGELERTEDFESIEEANEYAYFLIKQLAAAQYAHQEELDNSASSF